MVGARRTVWDEPVRHRALREPIRRHALSLRLGNTCVCQPLRASVPAQAAPRWRAWHAAVASRMSVALRVTTHARGTTVLAHTLCCREDRVARHGGIALAAARCTRSRTRCKACRCGEARGPCVPWSLDSACLARSRSRARALSLSHTLVRPACVFLCVCACALVYAWIHTPQNSVQPSMRTMPLGTDRKPFVLDLDLNRDTHTPSYQQINNNTAPPSP